MKKSLIGFLLASCVATSQPKSGQLVGHWRYTDVNARVDMEFGADGEFSGRVVREGAPVFTYSGKWTLKDADLDYVYTKSSLASIPSGTHDHDRLVELTKDYYVIEALDGSRRKYSRVK